MNARKIFSSVFFSYLGAITIALTGFIATPIVLGHLGKAAYGAWGLIAAIIGYSSLLDLGVGLTVMRQVAERAHLSDRTELRRITSTALTIYSMAGLLIAIAGVCIAGQLGVAFHLHGALRHQFTIAMILMSVVLGLTFPGGLYTGINQGFGRFRAQGLIVTTQALVSLVVTIAIMLLGGGLVALAVAWTVVTALAFGAKVIYAARALGIVPNPRRFERPMARGMMSISFWMFIINLANKVIWNTDTVVVGSVIGAIAVAHYSVALGPATAVRTLTDQFNSVTYTAAASLRAQSQKQAMQRLLLEATRVVSSCICPFVVLFLLWGSQFLRLWVGPSLASSNPTLVVLVIGMLSTSVQATATQILLASELQSSIAVVAVAEALANLACSIVLAHIMGIEGVALGTTIPTTITAFGFYLPKAARQLSIPLHEVLRRPVGPLLLSAGAYTLIRLVAPKITFPSLPVFCAFAVVFVGVLMIIGVLLDPEERRTYIGIVVRSYANPDHAGPTEARPAVTATSTLARIATLPRTLAIIGQLYASVSNAVLLRYGKLREVIPVGRSIGWGEHLARREAAHLPAPGENRPSVGAPGRAPTSLGSGDTPVDVPGLAPASPGAGVASFGAPEPALAAPDAGEALVGAPEPALARRVPHEFGAPSGIAAPTPATEIVSGTEALPDVSVVVCSHNGATTLPATLASLRHQSLLAERYEVIVVDDGSHDGTGDIARGAGAGVLRLSPNRGLAGARNAGVSVSRGEIVAFTDDNCEVDRDWLVALLRDFEDPDVDSVGGRVMPGGPDGFALRYLTARNPLGAQLMGSRGPGARLRDYLRATVHGEPALRAGDPLFLAVGANMAFRRKRIRQWRGFDEASALGGDEDLYRRAHLNPGGARIVYEPAASVVRRFAPSLRDTLRRSRASGRGNARAARKFPDAQPIVYPFPLACLCGVTGGALTRRPRAALLGALVPLLAYPRWLTEVSRPSGIEALTYPYIQLAQEVWTMRGGLDGYQAAYDPVPAEGEPTPGTPDDRKPARAGGALRAASWMIRRCMAGS